jgi:hypothetical protein
MLQKDLQEINLEIWRSELIVMEVDHYLQIHNKIYKIQISSRHHWFSKLRLKIQIIQIQLMKKINKTQYWWIVIEIIARMNVKYLHLVEILIKNNLLLRKLAKNRILINKLN